MDQKKGSRLSGTHLDTLFGVLRRRFVEYRTLLDHTDTRVNMDWIPTEALSEEILPTVSSSLYTNEILTKALHSYNCNVDEFFTSFRGGFGSFKDLILLLVGNSDEIQVKYSYYQRL